MKLLVVGAHPDDCEIGAGGLIAREGENAFMLSVTNGANDSRSWGEAREEMEMAAEILGCGCIIWDYPMDVHCSAQLVAKIDEEIQTNGIDTVVTHFINDTNQAHREVAEAAIAASRWVTSLMMMEPSPPGGRSWQPFRPQLYFDISEVYEKKDKAIKPYVTQINKYGDDWIAGVEAKETVRGWETGVQRAEAYEVIRMLVS